MPFRRPLRSAVPLVALVLLAGCGDSTMPDPKLGELTGRWAGSLWVGEATAVLQRGTAEEEVVWIHARKRHPGFVDEVLRVRVVFTGPGTYNLGPQDVSFMELVGGDGIVAEYSGSGSPAGVLRITRFDGPGGVVEGELAFTATTQSPFAKHGARARLEDGEFRATVQLLTLTLSP